MNAKLFIPCLLVAWSCRSPEFQTDHLASTDSAGIAIVVSDSSVVAKSAHATVIPAPELNPRGPSEILEFYLVEGLVPLDSSFGVINRGTGSLRIFDHGGTYLRSMGSIGGGPGEFQYLWFVRPYRGDSILAHDARNSRLTVFDSTGVVGREFHLASHELYSTFITPVASLRAGNLLVYSRAHMSGLVEYGITVDSSVFGLHDPDGGVVTTLGRWPTGARMRYLREGAITTLEAPFAPGVDGAAWRDGFCLGFGATFEVRCHDQNGTLRRILRVAVPGQPVTPELISRYEERQINTRPSNRRAAFRRIMDAITYPARLPVYDRVVGTPTGRLWVESYRPFREGRPLWWQLDEEGYLVGSVEFPTRFEPYIFQGGIVRGVWRDEFDVAHVQTYRMEWQNSSE